MNAEIVKLGERRAAVGEYVYRCGICGAQVFTMVRHDFFPSCMSCRMWCEVDMHIALLSGERA